MTDDLRWEAPPPRSAPGTWQKWPSIAEALRARPGEWAVVAVVTSSKRAAMQAWQINHGHVTSMPPGQYEAVSRLVDGEYRVYARYIGTTATPPQVIDNQLWTPIAFETEEAR